MRGASRASYGELRERLSAVAGSAGTAEHIGDQLFAVVRLLDSEHGLRRALADASKPSAEKADVVAAAAARQGDAGNRGPGRRRGGGALGVIRRLRRCP